MKILLYSSVFYPSIGGVETITDTLASAIVALGHECTVVTETEISEEIERSFKIVRKPSYRQRLRLVRRADIVHSNGASMALFVHARLCGRPFIWTHNGYQVNCIDGLGWVDGKPSPIDFAGSIKFHLKHSGPVRAAIGTVKTILRKIVANNVDKNVAATKWVQFRQPLRNQVQAYTPYPLKKFEAQVSVKQEYDFIYVGRLVSEKGVSTLLNAFADLKKKEEYANKKLLVVGDGERRNEMEELCSSLGIKESVEFCGRKSGLDLVEAIHKAEIAVVPSEWEEPMGGVALELLSAKRNIIVSENGGMYECVGDAGLAFPNGDSKALQACMEKMLNDPELRKSQKENAVARVAEFDELLLTKRYLEIYSEVIAARK